MKSKVHSNQSLLQIDHKLCPACPCLNLRLDWENWKLRLCRNVNIPVGSSFLTAPAGINAAAPPFSQHYHSLSNNLCQISLKCNSKVGLYNRTLVKPSVAWVVKRSQEGVWVLSLKENTTYYHQYENEMVHLQGAY